MLLLFALIPLLYLLMGAALARSINARQRFEIANFQAKPIEQNHPLITGVGHSQSCNLNPGNTYSRSAGCDCSHRGAMDFYKASGSTTETPTNPYLIMLGFPVFGLNRFLTGGEYTPKGTTGYDPEYVARLERECGIEPIKELTT